MTQHAYRPEEGSLDGIQFVVFEPARAQAAYPELAQCVLSLSRLSELTAHMGALAQQGVAYQLEVLPAEVVTAASALGFRLTTDQGIARAHRELSSYLAWKSADFMAKTSGFRPMDRFFAVAQGLDQVNFVYGIGSAYANGEQLQLLSTRERVCCESGALLERRGSVQPCVFGGQGHARIWLVPEMDFPGPKDYQAMAVWAKETRATRC